ncbi:MAG: DMT family transporter [Candidatus Bathyarchaeota archaeon]|nr:DMT family transporter [Candidatus Bathyarchaeota archaeon]
MLFEALALVTSLTNALGVTLIARGMKGSKPIVAAFYSVAIQAAILVALLLTRMPQLNWAAVGYFALGGILSLGVARLLNFVAMKGLGVAKTSALIGSSPVITTLLSIAILSESPDLTTIAGAATVALGVALISGASGFKIEKALLVGLAAALAYSLSNIASKSGVQLQPDPFLSATVGAVAGLIFISAYLAATGQTRDLGVSRQSLACFAATGVLSSVGWLAMMAALETGSVGVVTTIVYSYPLFALITTRLLMREEKLTTRTIIGSTLVVLGVAIVTLL